VSTILLTDYPWPDTEIEDVLLSAAGHGFVAGPSVPGSAAETDALVAATQPRAILTCWAPVTAKAIAEPGLVMVQRMGVGLDNIDVAAATGQGVLVANVPDYCMEEVSDHAIALLLALARGLTREDRAVKSGLWAPGAARLTRVSEMTVGFLGYGRIGQCAGRKLAAFGVRLLAHTRSGAVDDLAEAVPLDRLLGESDAIIVMAPLNEASHHLVDDARIAAMKPGAVLINVSRGAIVDNAALVRALARGHLSGAGLDVVEGEPNPPRDLVDRPDVIVTPHMAFSSMTAMTELRTRACQNVIRVLKGDAPEHPCNGVTPRV
jgi:D-3-phosphoglycerate dehydrogenase